MAWLDLVELPNTLCRTLLGQPATINGTAITAVFGSETIELSPQGKPSILARQPILDYRTADLGTQPVAGGSVVVAGQTYTVRSVHPDGQGWARLRLQVS